MKPLTRADDSSKPPVHQGTPVHHKKEFVCRMFVDIFSAPLRFPNSHHHHKMSIEEIPQGAEVNIIPKDEKKARELIKKLNLKQIKGISRVTFKQRGNLIYAIDQPDVYKSPAGTYVVFGVAKVDDMNQRLAEAQAAQQQAQAAATASEPADKSPESITADLQRASLNENKEEEADEGDSDETGLDANDISIIVEQTQVSRAKAVAALRKHKGDMVNAIMELS